MKSALRFAAAAMSTAVIAAPALAGSQCFKNLDSRPLYITLRYQNGDRLVMHLRPGEKRRFDNVQPGDAYCYSFKPIGANECPNYNPVHLTSCQNPKLM
jgi:hypothetical protein